jgi:hypothetical protein
MRMSDAIVLPGRVRGSVAHAAIGGITAGRGSLKSPSPMHVATDYSTYTNDQVSGL